MEKALALRGASTLQNLERETGFEPATSTLARSHSTAELLPLNDHILQHLRVLRLAPCTRTCTSTPVFRQETVGKYKGYLFLNQPKSYERYSRVLSRFYAHFPDKSRTYDYLRPDFESYKAARLKEGASDTTVNLELSVLRGFWRWMLRMDAPGVLFNPVSGVRVKEPKKRDQLPQRNPTENPADHWTVL